MQDEEKKLDQVEPSVPEQGDDAGVLVFRLRAVVDPGEHELAGDRHGVEHLRQLDALAARERDGRSRRPLRGDPPHAARVDDPPAEQIEVVG